MPAEILTPSVEASVVVLNYNGRHHLELCLSSLERQTHDAFEVIVVDNGSTDGSDQFVSQGFPWVRLIRLDKNIGFCGGNNVGIREAQGTFVALLNNDTEADHRWLESLTSVMRARSEVGMCASRMMRFWERSVIDNAGDLLAPTGCALERGRGQEAGPEFAADCDVFGACAGAALYRRSMLDEIGMLDERFFLTYEDLDLSFRARLAGYRCIYVADAVVYHKVRGTMERFPDQQVFQSQRNIEWVWLKNMPGWLMFKHLPSRLLYWIGSAWFFTKRGHGTTFWRAKLAALKGCVPILKQRMHIQRSRRLTADAVERLLTRDWLRAKLTKFRAT
jgi:GT2 family glycosyltransferase